MKIVSLHFVDYPGFSGHTINFESNATIPIISFLVGNNGSGKTKVLDVIYDILTLSTMVPLPSHVILIVSLNATETQSLNLHVETIKINYIKKEGVNYFITDLHENRLNLDLNIFSKVVYSTIEVNFENKPINAITAKSIDETPNPRERSINLSTEIPQMLVDIKSQDDAERGNFYEKHIGQTVSLPDNIGVRLKRFTDAFHIMYEGSKIFQEIKNLNNQKQIIFKDSNNTDIFLQDMSTGEKQIIYRLGYILKNIRNINGAIILIDEPEISLHPSWQTKFKNFLLHAFNGFDVQFIIATHSPYIFENFDESTESCIKIDKSKPISSKISITFPNLPNYKPSVGLISYLAYGIFDDTLHIELYTLLQIKENRNKITGPDGIETWLQDSNGGGMPIVQTFSRNGNLINETLMTWVRNKIHHRDEMARPTYSLLELKDSINNLILLLSN